MSKTSYKNTTDLIKKIATEIDRLDKGEMSLAELNELVEYSQDLYEHLIVLRYKAFDKHSLEIPQKSVEKTDETTATIAEPEEEPAETPASSVESMFDFTQMTEEETKPEPEEEQPIFDFTGDSFTDTTAPSTAEAENQDEAPENPNPIEEKVTEPSIPAEPEKEPENTKPNFSQTESETQSSLNDILKQSEDVSLRKQLQNQPVSDIKSHISIAKKFEYISSMFKGDSEAYNNAIELLNSLESGDAAREKLNEFTQSYEWNLEDKSIIKFIELVERRYL